jgi:hypothetical protein
MAIAGQKTGSGTNDNDVVILLTRTDPKVTYTLMSTHGAMDVFVSLDGTNFTTAPLSLTDRGATDNLPVLVTVAGRLYEFQAPGAKAVRVLQNGGTAVQNATLAYVE